MPNYPPEVNSELTKFAECAIVYGLRYMIIGGVALSLHAIERYTHDGDIWIEATPDNWEKLCSVIYCIGYTQNEVTQVRNSYTQEAMRFQLAGPLDILTRVHSAFDFADVYSRHARVESAGITHSVIGLEDLREVKVRTNRDKDKHDVILIDNTRVALNQPSLDKRTPLKKWWDKMRTTWTG